MKKISPQEALNQAYRNLYNSNLRKIDKHLDALIKAKKFIAKNKKSN